MKKNNYTQPTMEILELDIQSDIMTASGLVPPVENVPQTLIQTGTELQETDYSVFE